MYDDFFSIYVIYLICFARPHLTQMTLRMQVKDKENNLIPIKRNVIFADNKLFLRVWIVQRMLQRRFVHYLPLGFGFNANEEEFHSE